MKTLNKCHPCMKEGSLASVVANDRFARKRYIRPELLTYGSLTELTRVNGNDAFDGAIGSRQTT